MNYDNIERHKYNMQQNYNSLICQLVSKPDFGYAKCHDCLEPGKLDYLIDSMRSMGYDVQIQKIKEGPHQILCLSYSYDEAVEK